MLCWAFVGAEVPIQCGDRVFRIDLLVYHGKLHRYVAIELKLGHFEPTCFTNCAG